MVALMSQFLNEMSFNRFFFVCANAFYVCAFYNAMPLSHIRLFIQFEENIFAGFFSFEIDINPTTIVFDGWLSVEYLKIPLEKCTFSTEFSCIGLLNFHLFPCTARLPKFYSDEVEKYAHKI